MVTAMALRRIFLLVAFGLISVSAHAVSVVVTVEGTVISSDDPFNIFGFGVGANTLLGATATAQYSFEATNIPTTDVAPEPEIAKYRDGTDWIFATTTINTGAGDLSFSDSTVGVITDSADIIYLVDDAIGGSDPDQFFLGSYNVSSVFGSGSRRVI